jgi:hypothetical protein
MAFRIKSLIVWTFLLLIGVPVCADNFSLCEQPLLTERHSEEILKFNRNARLGTWDDEFLQAASTFSAPEKERLISSIIGQRLTEEPNSWAKTSERIAQLGPNLNLLWPFFRSEPELFRAYLQDGERVGALLNDVDNPADATLISYASQVLGGNEPAIRDLTADESQRVALFEVRDLLRPRRYLKESPFSAIAGIEDLALTRPEAISAYLMITLKQGLLKATAMNAQIVTALPVIERKKFMWSFLNFVEDRQIPIFERASTIFRLQLSAEEEADALKKQIPGQMVAIQKYANPLLAAQKISKTTGGAEYWLEYWLEYSLTLPNMAYLIEVQTWANLVHEVLGQKSKAFLTSRKTIIALMKHYGANGILHLYNLGIKDVFAQSLEGNARSAKTIMKSFARDYPDLLPASLIEMVRNFTGDRETFINLIDKYLEKQPAFEELTIQNIVASAFDLPKVVANELTAKESGRRLMAVTSHFMKSYDFNLLQRIDFSGVEKVDTKVLFSFLFELSNAYVLEAASQSNRSKKWSIKTGGQQLFERFFNLEFGAPNIHYSELSEATKLLRREILLRINKLLEIGKYGMRIEPEELLALEKDWIDVEPLLTILTRLNDPSNKDRDRAISELVLRTFKASLDRNFDYFKFRSSDARAQIDFLNETQLNEWSRPRTIVKLAVSPKPLDATRVLALANNALVPHLKEFFATATLGAQAVPEELHKKITQDYLKHEIKTDPTSLVKSFIAEYALSDELARALAHDVSQTLIEILLNSETDFLARRNSVRLLQGLMRGPLNLGKDEPGWTQVIADLRSIEKEIPKDVLDGEVVSQGMIATAFDHSPRFLLTLGDLVNTPCCLNYRDGSRRNAIPAYVVDANIQALATWNLTQRNFASMNDYKAVLNALATGQAMQSRFNGNANTFTFTIYENERSVELTTLPIGHAYLRQVVRLGYSNKYYLVGRQPTLLLEKEYLQGHPMMPKMAKNHRELFEKIGKEIGAVKQTPIHFPKSRNPGGVYSDKVGGTLQTEQYTFK